MRRHLIVGILAAVLVGGCASAPGEYARTAPSREVILAQEIVAARVVNAYEAVSRLRPEYLRSRTFASSERARRTPLVYLDDMNLGSVDALRLIAVDRITSIRYLSPTEAHLRWGPRALDGVIVVTTSRAPY